MISSSCLIYHRDILPGSGRAAAGSGSVKTDCLTKEESSLAKASLETQLQMVSAARRSTSQLE